MQYGSLAHEQVRALESQLEAHCALFKEVRSKLQQIPGVGPIVSATLIATLSDVHRFKNSKQVGSYAGLVPSMYSSGDKDKHGRITKRGSSALRSMLCEAALAARRPQSPLNPFYRKLVTRRGHKVAVVALAHRILRVAWSIMRSGEDFSLAKMGVEAGDFEKTLHIHYRLVHKGTKAA